MPNAPTGEAVATFVAEVVGREVTTVKSLQGSVANHDFLVRLADHRLWSRPGARNEMAAEAWACRLLGGVGIPVPRVMALELEAGPGGLPTLLLSFEAGAPSDDPSVLYRAGLSLRRVHAEHLRGWGRLVVDACNRETPVRGHHARGERPCSPGLRAA